MSTTTTTTTTTAIDSIEQLTRDYNRSRAELTERVQSLQDELQAVQRRRMRGIKASLARTQDAQDALANAIDTNRELFDKPKTVTIDGTRVGLMKGKGKIEWDDATKVIRLIRKNLPDQADTLIQIRETPARGAPSQLSTAQLRQVGCTVVETGEQILIKPQDSELEKLINRLLADTEDLEE